MEVLLEPTVPVVVQQPVDQAAHWDPDVDVVSFACFLVVKDDEAPFGASRRLAKGGG